MRQCILQGLYEHGDGLRMPSVSRLTDAASFWIELREKARVEARLGDQVERRADKNAVVADLECVQHQLNATQRKVRCTPVLLLACELGSHFSVAVLANSHRPTRRNSTVQLYRGVSGAVNWLQDATSGGSRGRAEELCPSPLWRPGN